jgi:hypothetical protein
MPHTPGATEDPNAATAAVPAAGLVVPNCTWNRPGWLMWNCHIASAPRPR